MDEGGSGMRVVLTPTVLLSMTDACVRQGVTGPSDFQHGFEGAVFGVSRGDTLHVTSAYQVPLRGDALDTEYVVSLHAKCKSRYCWLLLSRSLPSKRNYPRHSGLWPVQLWP